MSAIDEYKKQGGIIGISIKELSEYLVKHRTKEEDIPHLLQVAYDDKSHEINNAATFILNYMVFPEIVGELAKTLSHMEETHSLEEVAAYKALLQENLTAAAVEIVSYKANALSEQKRKSRKKTKKKNPLHQVVEQILKRKHDLTLEEVIQKMENLPGIKIDKEEKIAIHEQSGDERTFKTIRNWITPIKAPHKK